MADTGGHGQDGAGTPVPTDGGDGSPSPDGARRPVPGLAVASLVFGIAGVLMAQVPLVGRVPALVLGLLAAALGGVGVACNPSGARGSRRGMAVAGLTLGVVSAFEGLLGFASVMAVNAVVASLG